jgi:hypothetical protein
MKTLIALVGLSILVSCGECQDCKPTPRGTPTEKTYVGTAGTNGKDGNTGAKGDVGTNGKDGLNGTNGVDGTNGTNGTNGVNGVDGKDGVNGTNGSNGVDGTNGLNGTDGINGTNGKDGINGTNGKDADEARIKELEDRLNAVEDKNDEQDIAIALLNTKINNHITSITSIIATLQTQVNTNRTEYVNLITTLRNEFIAFKNTTNISISSINAQIVVINQKISALSVLIVAIQNQVNNVEHHLTILQSVVNSINVLTVTEITNIVNVAVSANYTIVYPCGYVGAHTELLLKLGDKYVAYFTAGTPTTSRLAVMEKNVWYSSTDGFCCRFYINNNNQIVR